MTIGMYYPADCSTDVTIMSTHKLLIIGVEMYAT